VVHRFILINDYSVFLIHVDEFQSTILIESYFIDLLNLTILPLIVRF
jgi:hypothetical protein